MLYMNTYHIRSENRDACIARFKEGKGQPPEGVKLVRRWHDVAGLRGFTLVESDDPVAVGKFAKEWSDIMNLEFIPVLSDEQLVKVLFG
jgi:hypothetical protein